MPTCDYCDGEELAYEMESGRGRVVRCIRCLAIEQGQQQFSKPFDDFVDNDKHEDSPVFDDAEHWHEHRKMAYEAARDWFRVLARLVNDEPLVKRDPEAIGTINEHTRTFLTNIMGSAAHYPPSEVIEAEGDPEQSTLGGDD